MGSCHVRWALFPENMQRWMVRIAAEPTTALRTAGLAAATIGVGIVWFVRR